MACPAQAGHALAWLLAHHFRDRLAEIERCEQSERIGDAVDILQPAYAGLYSGAIHPTAEAHAIVADHMVRHVRALIDKRDKVESAAQ